MRKKIGLICLSAMLITLAVGYSSNTTESIRANATAKKSNSEQKGRKRDYENDFADNIIDISESAVVSKNIVDSSEKISNDEASITLNKVIRGAEAEKIINTLGKLLKFIKNNFNFYKFIFDFIVCFCADFLIYI